MFCSIGDGEFGRAIPTHTHHNVTCKTQINCQEPSLFLHNKKDVDIYLFLIAP